MGNNTFCNKKEIRNIKRTHTTLKHTRLINIFVLLSTFGTLENIFSHLQKPGSEHILSHCGFAWGAASGFPTSNPQAYTT